MKTLLDVIGDIAKDSPEGKIMTKYMLAIRQTLINDIIEMLKRYPKCECDYDQPQCEHCNNEYIILYVKEKFNITDNMIRMARRRKLK